MIQRRALGRLSRQAAAFGVRVPRAGAGVVEVPGLDDLVKHVESLHAAKLEASRALIAGGVVDFESLAEFYRPGAELLDRGAVTGLFGVATGMRVRACFYSRGKSLFGVVSTFFAGLEFVVSVGERFAVVECQVPVADFQGTRATAEGLENFVVLTDTMRAELTRRGSRYEHLSTTCAFSEYTTGSFLPVSKGGGPTRAVARARGGGRVMVDSQAAWARGVHCARSEGIASEAVKGVLKLLAQRARLSAAAQQQAALREASSVGAEGASGQAAAHAEEESLELLLLSAPLPPSLVALTWPVVAGFSFAAKSWGVVLVEGLREVTFNEEAFARLVMPAARKRLIEALVLSHSGTDSKARAVTDVIAGKGEGTILLLHGPPGVGKTLTAEAIAELLHKPLYVVSMGELGTTPEALEERLLDVLDLCAPWGALVLIDEAEMLLERRAKNDIVRNAMVCVMLRLLEYYRGILFLTTNRVESLDPAFQSRVQCALRYEPLDAAARRAIWADLLARSAVGGADIDIDVLAAHALNGRQIKNALQLALALSRHERAPLAMHHLQTTLEVTTSFVREVPDGETG